MDFLNLDSFCILFKDEITTIKTLMSLGALKRGVRCPKYKDMMGCVLTEKKKVFRCSKHRCSKHELSYRTGSLFYGSLLKCRKIMMIARAWLQCESRDAAARSAYVCKESVTTWYRYFRELVAGVLVEVGGKIGGRGWWLK